MMVIPTRADSVMKIAKVLVREPFAEMASYVRNLKNATMGTQTLDRSAFEPSKSSYAQWSVYHSLEDTLQAKH